MLRRIAHLFTAEMAKTWRTKFPYLGIVASALMALVAKQSAEGLSQPGTITSSAYFAASINMSTTIVIPIFATIFAAMLVASETSRGTLRMVLTRPVSRGDFLTAKLLTGLAYLVILMLANIIPALLIARGYPIKPHDDVSITVPDPVAQIGIFGLAVLLTALPLAATVCFGFLVSVLSASVATAIGVAVGLLLSMQPIKQFIHFGSFELAPWLFSSYYDTAVGIADSKAGGMYEVWTQGSIYMLFATSLASAAVFTAIAYRSFLKRDLNS